jgi:hypothetical protein
MIENVPGAIVECGVFKGDSLLRVATCRDVASDNRMLFAFDTFGKFPDATFEADKGPRDFFVTMHGDVAATEEEVRTLLYINGLGCNTELIEGNICETVPFFARQRPSLNLALINLDTDLYEPAQVVLEHLWPMLSPGGILITDDYNIFPGETKAVQEFCGKQGVELLSLPRFNHYYLRK